MVALLLAQPSDAPGKCHRVLCFVFELDVAGSSLILILIKICFPLRVSFHFLKNPWIIQMMAQGLELTQLSDLGKTA